MILGQNIVGEGELQQKSRIFEVLRPHNNFVRKNLNFSNYCTPRQIQIEGQQDSWSQEEYLVANLIALVDLFYQTQVFFCVYRGIFPSFVEFYNFTGFSSEFFRFSRHFFCFYFSVFFRIFLQNDMMTFLGLTNIFPDLRNIFPNFNIFLDF